MKRKSEVNRLYTRPVLTKALRVPNELSFEEPVNPLLAHPLKGSQPDQTPLSTKKKSPQGKGSREQSEGGHLWNMKEYKMKTSGGRTGL